MLGKALIALAAATSWVLVPQAASAGYHCYGNSTVIGSPRCAGVGLGLQSPRWYYSNNYPYWIYYSERPYIAFRDVVGGCYLIRRPALDPRSGWVTRTVQVCDWRACAWPWSGSWFNPARGNCCKRAQSRSPSR